MPRFYVFGLEPVSNLLKTTNLDRLDFELEAKYSKIWGDLKVRFTNRHFLKSATTYLQTLQTTTGTDGSDEVTVGSTTFYTSDTPILDMYLGMDNR